MSLTAVVLPSISRWLRYVKSSEWKIKTKAVGERRAEGIHPRGVHHVEAATAEYSGINPQECSSSSLFKSK